MNVPLLPHDYTTLRDLWLIVTGERSPPSDINNVEDAKLHYLLLLYKQVRNCELH